MEAPPSSIFSAHWPEYLIEAGALAAFMLSASVFAVLLEHPASWLHQSIESGVARRVLMGLAMGGTAVAIIVSRWGQRSGAHMNPAVTLAFTSLGKVAPVDAAFYILAQVVGGIDHSTGMNNAYCNSARVLCNRRKIGFALDNRKGFFVNRRWVADVVHYFFVMLMGPSGWFAWG